MIPMIKSYIVGFLSPFLMFAVGALVFFYVQIVNEYRRGERKASELVLPTCIFLVSLANATISIVVTYQYLTN